ncbi:MAG: hypothetical protein C0511_01685 [Hyphomicrobium sp.]|nr:hypothetical protein [Hyphomicrobium sp.]PPC83686.1 MAG: hypothetical protein CTY40_01680 [Hyphomicrobium sp.]
MRALVLLLAGLAGLKIWAQDHIYRSAAEDALVHAYRQRAIDACQVDKPSTTERRKDAKSLQVITSPFADPASIQLVVGKRDVDVAIWDVDNARWAVRYKYPLLVLHPSAASSAQNGAGLVCEFDITLGTATISKPRS